MGMSLLTWMANDVEQMGDGAAHEDGAGATTLPATMLQIGAGHRLWEYEKRGVR